MRQEEMKEKWRAVSEEVITGMARWRKEHPKATFAEREEEAEKRVACLRTSMLQEAAQESELSTWSQRPQEQRPVCPQCKNPLVARGRAKAQDQDAGRASRPTATAVWNLSPLWVRVFSRLYEELDLTNCGLSPRVQEAAVHLAIWMPFEHAGKQLKRLLGVTLSPETIRQITEQAGAAYEQVQTQHAQPRAKGRTEPIAPQQLMSSDGAFVRVRARGWSEVKTLVIGEVLTPEQQKQQRRCSRAHSYFSRLQEVGLFTDRASVEIKRRGLEQARQVVAVQDGAEWLQGFVDAHRPDAVRILDFSHAATYVSELAEAIPRSRTPTESPMETQCLASTQAPGTRTSPAVLATAL